MKYSSRFLLKLELSFFKKWMHDVELRSWIAGLVHSASFTNLARTSVFPYHLKSKNLTCVTFLVAFGFSKAPWIGSVKSARCPSLHSSLSLMKPSLLTLSFFCFFYKSKYFLSAFVSGCCLNSSSFALKPASSGFTPIRRSFILASSTRFSSSS